ncbi:MAG: enoyl-CoA hydratase/isomerase family protein [Desulfuromonadales bacterium]|nr:enoyl-CoA hydratase/isomerase family protein [Desulfuromonadales bacterium]
MAANLILTRKDNRIGFITLNRPEAMNTFIPEFADQLNQALWDMENDDDVRVIVIDAAGKHFCTGISLDQFNDKSYQEYRKFLYGIDAFYHTLDRLNKPTIASVQGFALANGAGLSYACDLTVAADTATFGTTAINVGLICLGPAAPMMKIIGKKKTMELVLTGDMISAAEAEELGLVNKVVAADDLQSETLKLAEKLISKSPVALQIGKKGLRRLQDVPYHQGLESMDDLFAALCATNDAKEGVTAFLEKRSPVWQEK